MSGAGDELWRSLGEAVQQFANALAEDDGSPAPLVTQALVLWEEASVGEDGQTQRRVQYTVPSDGFSIAASIGLADAGRVLLRRDGLSRSDEEEL